MMWADFYSEGETRPYRPSNGTEGEIFDSVWCAGCERDASYRRGQDPHVGCRIIAYAMACRIDDPDYPKEWVTGGGKGPRCTAFIPKGEEVPPARCDKTADLFGGEGA
jgi:hypothetical protein